MSVIDSRRYGRRSTTSFTRRTQNGKADSLLNCEVPLHDWAVSQLMSELKKGEARSESEWIPEEDILEEFGVAL